MSNLIFTNNALRSIHQYDLTKDIIYGVVHNYDRTSPGRESGTTIYHRATTASGFVSVVARQKGNDTLVISCWAKKSMHHYRTPNDKEYNKASFWKRVLLDLIGIFKS
jgi:hypothetical protein